jgi:hypothetical protein
MLWDCFRALVGILEKGCFIKLVKVGCPTGGRGGIGCIPDFQCMCMVAEVPELVEGRDCYGTI